MLPTTPFPCSLLHLLLSAFSGAPFHYQDPLMKNNDLVSPSDADYLDSSLNDSYFNALNDLVMVGRLLTVKNINYKTISLLLTRT